MKTLKEKYDNFSSNDLWKKERAYNIKLKNEMIKQKEDYEQQILKKEQHISNLEGMLIAEKNHVREIKHMIYHPWSGIIFIVKKTLKKILPSKVTKGLIVLRGEGFFILLYRISLLQKLKKFGSAYEEWIRQNEIGIKEIKKIEYTPLISIIVPVYNVLSEQLKECIESVLDQTYTNWELCMVDDASTWDNVKTVLKEYENINKIKIGFRKENGHISQATNSALELATGEFIAFLDCDDTLAPNALFEMAKKLNEDSSYDFIYSDEDKIDENGNNRHSPFFKPDWSPDTFLSFMYTCHFGMYRKSIADEIGNIRVGYEGAQDYDFTLRFIEKTNKIAHIPKILYHWREREESTAKNPNSKNYIYEATLKAKKDCLERRKNLGDIIFDKDQRQFRIDYKPIHEPLISIIIPSKDNFVILKQCIDSIIKHTTYKNYEIIIIDNGSKNTNKEKYLKMSRRYNLIYEYEKKQFNFSYMCNKGRENAKGNILLFLNDDVEVITENWLELMSGQAQQAHTGAVGAKLLYPNSKLIQHVGVVNLKVGPSHSFLKFDDDGDYYFGRNKMVYNYCAVTGACLMIETSKFDEIGGFDEELPVAYNDVELCFKAIEHNYYNVVRNDIKLYHHESISRGIDHNNPEKMNRLRRELELLFTKHPIFRGYDPFYNINLAKDRIDYTIDDSMSNKLNTIRKIKWKHLKYDKSVCGNIDSINLSELLKIDGWSLYNKSRWNNYYKKYIYLLNINEEIYEIETEKVYRPDIGNAMNNHKLNLIAFSCLADITQIPKQEYEIVVAIELMTKRKKYYKTGQKIRIL